jgi:hypothetical protein
MLGLLQEFLCKDSRDSVRTLSRNSQGEEEKREGGTALRKASRAADR